MGWLIKSSYEYKMQKPKMGYSKAILPASIINAFSEANVKIEKFDENNFTLTIADEYVDKVDEIFTKLNVTDYTKTPVEKPKSSVGPVINISESNHMSGKGAGGTTGGGGGFQPGSTTPWTTWNPSQSDRG